jgi:hypothetical protein
VCVCLCVFVFYVYHGSISFKKYTVIRLAFPLLAHNSDLFFCDGCDSYHVMMVHEGCAQALQVRDVGAILV